MISAGSADPTIGGGEATDTEGQSGDMMARVCVCIEAIDVFVCSIVEDVGFGVGDIVSKLPVTGR
jgi:hypothetical protein